ncbi:unnamed protein product [Adineta steineri]|uniref:NACHT domain-containing protein n=2 Tax=Adineta steineri TaxID=433720 RepID=A0A813RQM9_9BILA|nr:unnamed protein product [Adineta steineri]CAF0810871.1 unnamed protein product [Adineta steineri]
MTNDIQKIKKDLVSNNVVVFVGPDISVYTANGDTTVSYWKGLLNNGLNQCYRSTGSDEENFAKSIKKLDNSVEVNDYAVFADRIKYCFEEQTDTYEAWLTDTIGQLHPQKPDLVKAIGKLGCPILTTNYDSLLEDILNRETLTWNKFQSSDSLTNYILHIYGHYQSPNTVIFSSNDYHRIHEDELACSQLRRLVEGKTLLFVGYGMGMPDPSFCQLLKWIFDITSNNPPTIYKLIQSNVRCSLLENIEEISYGNTFEDLVFFLQSLPSFATLIHKNLSSTERRENVRRKYLNYLINEYGHVSIFGYSNNDISLPLESVYVELKFDPTHPSIKAMKTIDMYEEFKRKVLSYGFFDDNEKQKLIQAIIKRSTYNPEGIYRDLMIDQWLNVLLSNKEFFSEDEADSIRNKISQLKQNILKKNNFQESKQYQIQQAFNEFKHFIILGHPGSGKTTISKWLVMNMAQQCLGKKNMLFNTREKIPILIPIWKYVNQIKDNPYEQKLTLLQFIHENVTLNSLLFTNEERQDLSSLIIESLLHGNVLIIFEGLDEVPAHVDRTDLLKDINALLERGIDYDSKSNKLTHSIYEQKEINNTKDPTMGNRFIITSRIEGNYFEDINFYIPRLTIQDMSNESLKLFCNSYTECINKIGIQTGKCMDACKTNQLYNDITENKDIFQLAINPQLASVIAAVYNQYDDKLPEKRIDLYEKAIEKMIERLVTSSINEDLQLNAIILWSILQKIAEYLHNIVEGLSENNLREIIRKCLIDYQEQLSNDIDDLISKLVDIFKYKVGLLNEFGHNSFRFIHRTFQEYLAAKSIIYFNGIERSIDEIYENIKNKIDIPNWRVPLSMTFGILSKLHENNDLFHQILERLLTNESISSSSTLVVPFVIIDSLNDMYFPFEKAEHKLMCKLADMLLNDYKNLLGFSRLKEHQKLIHSYFFKLKQKSTLTMISWFIEKMNDETNIAPCANIIYQLKWYSPKFHDIFLRNLHNDSQFWDWPIDSLLRFYSTEIKDQSVLTQLQFKKAIIENSKLIEYITKNNDWLCLITALYGGYKNYNTQATVSEYNELAQFLALSENQRAPFTFYYQNVWGMDDPIYNMAVRADAIGKRKFWNEKPGFDENEIYKESFLTRKILEFLSEERSARGLKEELQKQLNSKKLCINEQIEIFIALVALGDFDFASIIMEENNGLLTKYFGNRLEQLIYILKDPIARYFSYTEEYLLTIYNNMKIKPLPYGLNFCDYSKIYLSLIVNSGGLPVDTHTLAETTNNMENKCALYAEYFAYKLTSSSVGDIQYTVAVLLDTCIESMKSDLIIKSFLKINDTVQIYKPVRAYPWALDMFTFKSFPDDDIPIGFFNCLENIHTNIAFVIQTICNVFLKEEYFNKNPELIPLVILLVFGIQSKDLDKEAIYVALLPELTETINIKECLYNKIQLMRNPYYKSRALYQLAQFDDENSNELLTQSFQLTKLIQEPVLKFQVLEKIYYALHYKQVNPKLFIQQIIDELILTSEKIEDRYDRVIALTRLSFYGSGEFRKKYLANTLEILIQMDENHENIKLIIKLKPLISIYDDLQNELKTIIQNFKNKTHNDFVNSYYGRILFNQKVQDDIEHTEFHALFRLFAQLNDIKLVLDKDDSLHKLWINFYKDINNQSNIEKILNVGLNNELFLTPQAAIIIDELIQQGQEEIISVLFPYIIKPSNEVLPIVQRWFTDCQHNEIKKLAALLLVESKYIFESAMDTIVDLIKTDNDQMRYRAQRIFQHPERDPKEPSKRISIIGEKTLMKILQTALMGEHLPRVQTYLRHFFFDLLWDDPKIIEKVIQLKQKNLGDRRIWFLYPIKFINEQTWNSIIQLSSHSFCAEELLHSVMDLTIDGQITAENWMEFRRILSVTDRSQFIEKLYFSGTELETIAFIINEICVSTNVNDEMYFASLESKLISEMTIRIEDLYHNNYDQIKHIGSCNFRVLVNDLNQSILDIINDIPITIIILESLIQWLIQKMINLKESNNSIYSLMMSNNLLSLVAACVQKEDYLYRKITNSQKFNKIQMIKLLEYMINHHPYFPSRGSAFILLAAMDLPDHKIIINALNSLFDENIVKQYTSIGIPYIHLPPNELVDDLLKSLTDNSAIKVYETLKIITEFTLDEKINANTKSKIIHYLANEIGQFKSKKLVNYYYTDIKIPFTTTLENELYKTWTKIQGLAGKTQYTSTTDQ